MNKRCCNWLPWVIAGILVCGMSGCKQGSDWPAGKTAQSETTADREAMLAKYNDYLLLMEPQDRAEFFKLETDAERDRFLQSQGILQKKYLNDHLAIGMPKEKVEALKELGTPIQTEDFSGPDGRRMEWIYDDFNGYRRVRYAIAFCNNKVVEWSLWLP